METILSRKELEKSHLENRFFPPYRICPIGAHIDHQGGAVLGRTITIGTMFEYEPLDSNKIHITSDQFGEADLIIGDLDKNHWTRYAQAAAVFSISNAA